MQKDCLQYVPFSSMLDTGFWHNLAKRKLEEYKLEDQPVPLSGYYTYGSTPGLPAFANIEYTAFDLDLRDSSGLSFLMPGLLKNFNTLESFREAKKQDLLNDMAHKMWQRMLSGDVLTSPQEMTPFLLLTFADLKKYQFYYWFAFGALNFPSKCSSLKDPLPIGQYFTDPQLSELQTSYQLLEGKNRGFFLVQLRTEGVVTKPLSQLTSCLKETHKVMLGFADPSNFELHPGWPLRNFLALIALHSDKCEWDVLCFREQVRNAEHTIQHSFVLSVLLEKDSQPTSGTPSCVGWEKNEQKKLGPRKVDLSRSMNPTKLAESAVDLNLKLMKWRLAPDIDLEKMSHLKCLLFGAGTLGCHVARCLLGWGIRHITFVDNGSVSYSNPVRQSLFTFEDCLNGGRPKAEAAAEALTKIFPSVVSKGYSITVPMPGHSIPESTRSKVHSDVIALENLVEENDVVFLLTDTRESRWLPSLMACARSKMVINAALGFDTFLVVRHGVRSSASCGGSAPLAACGVSSLKDDIPGSQVGCYFCNDVVAPGDSTRDRTLDQQCTVTRPGVSMMAASLATELLISMIQHPLGSDAPACASNGDTLLTDSESPLGIVPHQIRGFMSRFYHILPSTKAFERCTACSSYVLNEYLTDGFEFLLKVFNNPSYLEDITGLKKMQEETDLAEVWELSDSDSA